MDDSAPQPGYHNYEQTESRKELNLKKILIGFGILIAVLAAGYFIIQAIKVANDTYNEDEEPLIEYVENAEPLAGLQFLTESGLDDKQYKQVTETLSKFFQENHSEYKVVQYVDATFDDSRAFTDEGCELQDILDEEEELAVKLYDVASENSTIGFEAANHYFFNKYSLAEKIVNLMYLKEYFG